MNEFDYINQHYGLSVKAGDRVTYSGGAEPVGGTITGTSGAHLKIRLDGKGHDSFPFHPTWKLDHETATPQAAEGEGNGR